MSKSANPGELRTPVEFKRVKRSTNENGRRIEEYENVFGDGVTVNVKWVNAHGYEAVTAMQLGIRELATITARYSPLIDRTLTVFLIGDDVPYEIVDVDNVEQRNRWLEIKSNQAKVTISGICQTKTVARVKRQTIKTRHRMSRRTIGKRATQTKVRQMKLKMETRK